MQHQAESRLGRQRWPERQRCEVQPTLQWRLDGLGASTTVSLPCKLGVPTLRRVSRRSAATPSPP
jgi:hypothetical protein